MPFYFIKNKRVVELRENAPDEGHWTDYFMDDANDQARPSVLRRLGDAEAGTIMAPYGQILEKIGLKNKKIVDLGCGIGAYVLALHRKGYSVEGVEYSSRLVAKISKEYPELLVHCEDATKTHYIDSSIDIVLSLGVVEHKESGPQDFISEIRRVLKTDGTLLITVPYFNVFWKLRIAISDPYDPFGINSGNCQFYQYRFSAREFKDILKKQGFDIVSCGSSGSIKSLEDSFPFIKKLYLKKGGYRIRQSVIKPFVEKMPMTGHMLWVVARKK